MRNSHRFLAAALAAVTMTAAALPASAAIFNPHRIIDDEEMRRFDAMSYDDIRTFLASKGSLSGVVDIDPADGLLKNAAQIVDDAAKRYKVNPKYILALIQKESSAVESSALSARQLDWATGYALCDGCYRSAPLAQKYKGFARQVDAGAGFVDWYYTSAEAQKSYRKPGETYIVSGTPVTPANVATAALYSYTPHLHGNRLLWSIWNRWFGDGMVGLKFPDGTLIRNEKTGGVALVQGGKMRPILNQSVLATRFNASTIVDLNEYDFDAMRKAMGGRPVRFPDLSLVRDEFGTTYLLIGASKRRIVSQEAFAKIGFNPEEVEGVTFDDISDYHDADPISHDTAYPLGELLQDTRTGGVYYAENGVKRPIWDRAVLSANFPGRPIVPAKLAVLDGLATGDPMPLADGALVKAPDDPSVFVISGGKKRAIPTEETFRMFGYKFSNVLTASRKMLALHPDGEPLTVESAVAAPTE